MTVYAIDATTDERILVVCDRCKQRQPNAVNEHPNRFHAGCLRCDHPEGRYA